MCNLPLKKKEQEDKGNFPTIWGEVDDVVKSVQIVGILEKGLEKHGVGIIWRAVHLCLTSYVVDLEGTQ